MLTGIRVSSCLFGGEGWILEYLHELYLLNGLIAITGYWGFFFLIFLDVGLVISNSTLSDLTSLTSFSPCIKAQNHQPQQQGSKRDA